MHSDSLETSRQTVRVYFFLTCAMAALLLAPVGGVRAEPPAGYPFLSYDEGLEAARKTGRHVFVYFGRLGCGWCEKTNKEAFSDPEVKARYTAHYVLVYVDTESGRRLQLPNGERLTEMAFAARLRIIATPVFAFLEPDGTMIFKVPGVQHARDFLRYDRYVHEGIYRHQDLRSFLAAEP
jgi:thioredoxin-related protein